MAQAEPFSEPPSELDLFKLEYLLNARFVAVASRTPESSRETPGLVSVITRDEISASGARDLVDVLQLVPGFQLGLDVGSVAGLGVRGLWGHEGKVLLLVDGQEMNELLYSTLPIASRISALSIERVEIVRGPGSAMYGGYAELAVIHVITRSARDLRGLAASTYYGQMERTFGRGLVSASYGQEIARARGLALTLHLHFGRGRIADRVYQDAAGNRWDMATDSAVQTASVNFGAEIRGLRLRFLFEDYHVAERAGFGPVLPKTVDQRFLMYQLDLAYDWRITSKIRLTPRLNYRHQTPWQDADERSPTYFDKQVQRLRASLILSYDILASLNLLVGLDGYYETARLVRPVEIGLQRSFGGSNSVEYGNLAAFAQVIFRNWIANLTAGARYEWHNHVGSSFVPRVGLTRAFRRLHFKLLFSQAFRAPGIENINLNTRIQPEETSVLEGEAGWRITDEMLLSAAAFWITIDRPILYGYDAASNSEIYFNADRTGTAGIEAEYRFKYYWGFLNLNYSFYSSAGQNRVMAYAVPRENGVLLGLAAHKLAFNAGFNLYRDKVAASISGVFLSERWGYVRGDVTGEPVLGREPALFLLNFMLEYRNLGLDGLNLAVGAYNVLGADYRLVQPYSGGHLPLPTASREFFVRLSYQYALE